MESPFMYLLLFKNPSEIQINNIRNTFSDFDWSQGFGVEEIIVEELINNKLIIQFVSFKKFFLENNNEVTLYPNAIESVLTGKGQFLGSLLDKGLGIENLETFFCYLGVAADSREGNSETIYKVEYGKYSKLINVNLTLENILN